jgi:hypothetical protein
LQYRICICIDTIQSTNTFDGHRLSHYAAAKGKVPQMTERLLTAAMTAPAASDIWCPHGLNSSFLVRCRVHAACQAKGTAVHK